MASSSERLWMTLTVAAGTLVVTALVLSAPAVQRCSGAAEGIWSCLRQQVIDYGLLPADEPGPAVTIADPSVAPVPAPDATEPEIVAEPVETQSEPIPEPPLQTAMAPETAVTPVPDTALTISPSGDATAAEPDMPAPQDPADDAAQPPDTDLAAASAADPSASTPSSAESPAATETAAAPPVQTAALPETPATPLPDDPLAIAPPTGPGVEQAPAPEEPQDLVGAPNQIEGAGPQPVPTVDSQPKPIAPVPGIAEPPVAPPASESPLQVAAAPETAATPEPASPLPGPALPVAPLQTPDIVPPVDTGEQGPENPEVGMPRLPEGGLEPAPVVTPVLPTAPVPAISAAAAATRSASAALRTSFEVAAPLLRLTAQPTSGIGVALLAGLKLMQPMEPAVPPARPALTPSSEPGDPTTLAPAEPDPVTQPAGPPVTALPTPSIADSPLPEALPTPAPAAPLAPAVGPLQPAGPPLRPAPLAPAESTVAKPETRPGIAPAPAADAATEPAPGLSPARPAGPLPSPSPVSDPVPPVPEPPPGPTIVADARLGTAPSGRVEIAPTIDAVEIDGVVNRIAGTGPEGARVDLFIGQRYIASATVEGGRWLVEAERALIMSGQRLRLSVDGGVAAGSGVDLAFNVAPPGVRLVGKQIADATLGQGLQPESELEPDSVTLTPLTAVSPELLRFQSGKAIVRRGDTLWAIARRVYGRGILYRQIFEANREHIRRPGRIYPGQVFALPAAP